MSDTNTPQRYSIFCKEVTLGEDPDADEQIKLSATTNSSGNVEFKVKKKTRTTDSGTETTTETETDLFQINEEGGIDKIKLPVHTDFPDFNTEYSLNDVIVHGNTIYQVREDTSNPPVKSWEAIGSGQILTAGTGLSIDNNEISIDGNAVVQTTGDQTIAGSKTFNSLTKIYGATASQSNGLLIGTESEKSQHEREGDLLTVYRNSTAPVRINIQNESTGSATLKLTTSNSTFSIANVSSELRIYNDSANIATFTAGSNFEITNGFKVATLNTENGFVRTDEHGNFSTDELTASDLSGIIGDGLYYDSTNGGSITIDSNYTATRSYVDSVVQGLDVKDSVRVATTGDNIDLNSVPETIDAISLSNGDRVLLKDQDNSVENGIYIYDNTATQVLTRAPDFASNSVVNGAFTFVEEGTANANLGFVQTSSDIVTIGTNDITFTQFSGAGQIDAGTGISKVGNTLSIDTNVVPTLANSQLQPSQIPFASTSSVGGFKVGENLEMNNGVLSASAGIKTVPDSSGTSSLSTSILYPNVDQTQQADTTNSGTEGEIIYNESNNKFYEASGDSTVAFRPLGYSFFSENMEGQAPIQDKAFFFFELTPFSIKLSWTNPTQYPTGITANPSQILDENSPIVTAPANGVGGLIYFPVVNRIMVQIKKINIDQTHTYTAEDYITITDKTSPVSNNISGLKYGRVICSKDFPIPPLNSTFTDSSELPTFDGGRDSSVYTLDNFATSMILHLDNNNKLSTILATADSQSFIPTQTLPNHPRGYEIKFWYENQYNSGSMSEADFNVQTFTTTENGTDLIKFVELDPPSDPGQPTFSLVTRYNEVTDKTFVSLDVLDPSFVAGSDITYNTDINFSSIKFEYANYNEGDTLVWQELNHRYIFSEALDEPVRENITNGQYTPPDGLIHQAAEPRNFLFDLREILNDTPTDKVNHKFRVSYKNSNNVDFSNTIESNVITIDKPETPYVESVKMYNYNKLEIVIPPYSHNNAIIGSTTTTDPTNHEKNDGEMEEDPVAVIQLEKIEFQITKKEDSDTTGVILNSFDVYYLDDSEPSNHQLILIEKDINTNYYSINQNQNTGNQENLKFYVQIDHNDIDNTSLTVNYEIQVKVRNTINSEFTEFSTPNSTFKITKPDTSILTTDPVIFSLSSTKNNTLDIKLGSTDTFTDNLVAGSRGVITEYLSNPATPIPTITEFLWQSDNLKYGNVTSTLTAVGITNSSTSISTDASGYLDSKANFYDTLKYDGTNSEKTEDLHISIKYKNFYINAYNDSPISSAYRLRATAPSIINPVAANPSDPNFENSIKNTLHTLNTAEINWNAINIDSGLNFGLAYVDSSGNVITELSNTITNYKLKVEITSSDNRYLNQQHSSSSWPTAYEQNYSNTDTTPHKTSTDHATIPDSVELNNILSQDLLLWPETTYKVTIDTTNSLGYTSTHDPHNFKTYLEFTTPTPEIPDGLYYFGDPSYGLDELHSTGVTTDLQDSTITYGHKGILMSEAINPTTVYDSSNDLVQISNGNNLTQIISQTVHHIINKVNAQSILTNEQVYNWSETGVVDSEETITKFAINRIENSGSTEIYSLEGGLVTSTNHSALFTINRTERQDAYKFSQDYDQKNYGYWYMENIAYTINDVSIPSEDYGKPLKYELANYYRDNGNENYTTSSSSTTILKNSANNSEYIYFDELNLAPTIGGTPGTELSITYNQSATINGIPNLALFDNTDTFDVSYLAQNYSTRFLLDSSKNVAEHYFTYSSEILSPISWSTHTAIPPSLTTYNYERNSDHWQVQNLALTPPTNVMTATPRYDVELKINLTSTHSTSDLTPYTQRFIYDKDAKDMIDGIKSSMYYDEDFDGELDADFAKSPYNPTESIDMSEVNTNQLNVYGSRFFSNKSWKLVTGIDSSNVVNYPKLDQNHPVFADDNNYKTVIFKYTKAPSAASSFIKVICAFGSLSDIDVTDFDDENIRVYLHQGKFGANHSGHYWLKLSTTNSSITSNIATNQQITYVGELAYSKMGGSSQMTLDEFTSGNGIADGTFVNADATGWKDGIVPKKMLGAFVNKISYNSSETLDFYLAIQLKNNVTKDIIKPDLYILNNKVSVLQLD